MEIQKIKNFVNDSSSEESNFVTKKWCVINNQTAKDKYDQNNSIKFQTGSIKSSLCDYSDAFILVAGNIKVTANNNTNVVFKTFSPFFTCKRS